MMKRPLEFLCRVRKFAGEDLAKRCLWAMKTRHPGRYDDLEVKRCSTCSFNVGHDVFHMVRRKV